VCCAIGANAPDLDFLPGLVSGDINRFHQGVSHSVFAALVFGGFLALTAACRGARASKIGLAAFSLYSSHLLADFFCEDKRAPWGIPLWWPVSKEHFISPRTIFQGVKHGVPGQDLKSVLVDLFSWHNLEVVGIEAMVLLPVLLIAWLVTSRNE